MSISIGYKKTNEFWLVYNFIVWDGRDVLFQYPYQLGTAVVFQADGAEAIAKYKGFLTTNDPVNSFSSNGTNFAALKAEDAPRNYYLVYEDGGDIWLTINDEPEILVSDGKGNSKYPSIAVYSAQVASPEYDYCIVWQQYNGSTGKQEILCKTKDNINGNPTVLRQTTYSYCNPVVSAAGFRGGSDYDWDFTIVWRDTDGIYFRKLN